MSLIRPMLATAGEVPPGRSDEFAFEIKWDGVRLITYVDGATVKAVTRNDREVSATYPEIAQLADALDGRPAVLDGEIVAFNAESVVHFGTLQQRMHIADPAVAHRLMTTVPAIYVVFDLLSLDGEQLMGEPYERRRRALLGLGLSAPRIQVPPTIDGDAVHALEVSRHMNAEGIVAKRHGSRYYPGQRSSDWVKIKHQRMQEVVIGGWRPGNGRRHGTIGALLMGLPTSAGLRYVGRVGTGFTDGMLRDLAAQLEPIARDTPPFLPPIPADVRRDARWVEPRLVGEIRYGERTSDGIYRHPAWRGLRPDKSPGDVVVE